MALKLNICHGMSAEGMLKTFHQEMQKHEGEKEIVMTENPYVITYEQISTHAAAVCIREYGKKVGLCIRNAGLGYFLAAGVPCKMEDVSLQSIAVVIERNPNKFEKLFNAAFQYWDYVNAQCGKTGLLCTPDEYPFLVYTDFVTGMTDVAGYGYHWNIA